MKQRARETAATAFHRLFDEPETVLTGRTIVDALSTAGLLVTDLHERALEACKKAALAIDDKRMELYCVAEQACIPVGREALAREQDKETGCEGPWLPRRRPDGTYYIWKLGDLESIGLAGKNLASAQAHAAAQALNDLHRKEQSK